MTATLPGHDGDVTGDPDGGDPDGGDPDGGAAVPAPDVELLLAPRDGVPDVVVTAWALDDVVARYRTLWEELTHVEEFPSSQRHRIEGRIRRL